MWIDEVQEAEAGEADTTVAQLEVDPSIEELRAAREATQLQLTQLDEQVSSLERDTIGDTRFAKKVSEMNEKQRNSIVMSDMILQEVHIKIVWLDDLMKQRNTRAYQASWKPVWSRWDRSVV